MSRTRSVAVALMLWLSISPVIADGVAQKPRASSIVDGRFSCDIRDGDRTTKERLTLVFQADKGQLKEFSSSWVISSDSPDVRPGYAVSCQADTEKFQQIARGNAIVLKYRAHESEKYMRDCEIRIWVENSNVRVRSSKCTSSCTDLNLIMEKNTGRCRRLQ